MKCISATKQYLKCLFLIVGLIFNSYCFSKEDVTIKLAIIDNFHFQKNIVNHFESYYKPGIVLAQKSARKSHYKIVVRYFDYNRTSLGVFDVIPEVKAWNPDVIIGPRNSNVFLLLNGQFTDVLVLSPFATADSVESLPKNFYSLAFPDHVFSKSILRYLENNFPKKRIFGIIEADCKNCMDIANGFKTFYDKVNLKSPINYQYFSGHNDDNLNVKDLLKSYSNEEIIFLPNNSAVSALLMPMIVNFLGKPILFVGGDDWGTWNNTQVGKFYAKISYHALRFTPLSFDLKTEKVDNFIKEYTDFYKKPPEDVATYMSYNTVMSFVEALNLHENSEKSMREKILKSYLKALKKNKNWFKNVRYYVYDISPKGSNFIGSCPVEK